MLLAILTFSNPSALLLLQRWCICWWKEQRSVASYAEMVLLSQQNTTSPNLQSFDSICFNMITYTLMEIMRHPGCYEEDNDKIKKQWIWSCNYWIGLMFHQEEMLTAFDFHYRNIPKLLLIATCCILLDWYLPSTPLLWQFFTHLTVC